jgi:hypothetical protein
MISPAQRIDTSFNQYRRSIIQDSALKVNHTRPVRSYCDRILHIGRMRIPLSYNLFGSSWFPSVCIRAKGAVLIQMAFSNLESVAIVELVHGTLKCATLY